MNETTTLGVILAIGILLAAILSILWHLPGTLPRGDATSSTPEANRQLREVVDMTSRKAHISKRPVRILSLCTSATDTIVAVGATDRLIAIDEFSRIVPGAGHAKVVGAGSAISREQVVALRVDLAFIWWYQDDAAAMLEDLAIPVVRIRSGRAAELPAMIRLIGDCVDSRQAAERAAGQAESFLANPSPQPIPNAKRVFLELYGPLKTVGGETYTNDLLQLAGARNVAADAKGSVLFSAERLVQADPDIILVVGTASDRAALVSRPGMAELRAVREGRVLVLDRYWLVAGPQMPQSVEWIRKTIFASPTP